MAANARNFIWSPNRLCNGQPCGEATLKAVQPEGRLLTNLLSIFTRWPIKK